MKYDLATYIDSTFLATPTQSGFTEAETLQKAKELTKEAHEKNIFAVMLRPALVPEIRAYLDALESKVQLGTVIDFPLGNGGLEQKRTEANEVIQAGADELDFVVDYEKYINKGFTAIENEISECTKLCLENNIICKWILEVAALSDKQIAELSAEISVLVEREFPTKTNKVFLKSSTGFYTTKDGKANGATTENIKIMLANAGNLPVKASGGVRTTEDAMQMIALGVQRIGTSFANVILTGE